MIFDYISQNNSLPFDSQVGQNFTAELQWSPNFLVGVVLDGTLTLHYESHSREFKQYDILFFAPMKTFSVISSSADAKVLFFYIDTQFITQFCSQFPQLHFEQNHVKANLSNEVYILLCSDIATLIFNNLKKDVSTKLRLLISISHLVTTLFENYGVISAEAKRDANASASRKLEILKYIDTHFSEPMSVTDISAHLGLHPQYFSSYFKKTFGKNFLDYLNTYRINHSIYDLSYTDDSIINIALNHGFNSHKTYSTAFKRLYHCTPMEYRHTNYHNDNDKTPDDFDTLGSLSYFRQFLQSDYTHSPAKNTISTNAKLRQELHINATNSSKYENISHVKMLSVGRAYACLRSEVQKQLIQAKKELDFEHLRIRDIFSDDLHVYFEDQDKTPKFNWNALDSVFDFILSIHVKPFCEIGYMPSALASKKQYAGVSYHPNVSAPKDMKLWSLLIHEFISHLISHYGAEEVESWYFNFWTSPDLEIKDPYWNESQEEFFQFYEATYRAIQAVNPKIKLATANFSTITGYHWYDDFFQYCYVKHIYPAFVDFHVYGTKAMNTHAAEASYLSILSENYSVQNPNNISNSLNTIQLIMNRNGFRALDIIVSDWNLSFLPQDLLRDTCFMSTFISHVMIQNIKKVKAMCYWTLSDIHDDAFFESKLFNGGPGLMDYHGTRKASYNALALLSSLGNTLIDMGENHIATQKDNRYQILIYNHAQFDAIFSQIDRSAIDESHRYQIYDESTIQAHISIDLPCGQYCIKHSEVNRQFGSSYDLWCTIGAPEVLTPELKNYLQEESKPHVTFSVAEIEDTYMWDETIPAHGIVMVEFIPT